MGRLGKDRIAYDRGSGVERMGKLGKNRMSIEN